jgi:hypothetical protein
MRFGSKGNFSRIASAFPARKNEKALPRNIRLMRKAGISAKSSETFKYMKYSFGAYIHIRPVFRIRARKSFAQRAGGTSNGKGGEYVHVKRQPHLSSARSGKQLI